MDERRALTDPGAHADDLPLVIISDRQDAAFTAFLAGIADARAGLPALVDPRYAAQRWAWLEGWQCVRRAASATGAAADTGASS